MKKGIPKQTICSIIEQLTDNAIENANDIMIDRIYSVIALSVHDFFGTDHEKTMEFMHFFDGIVGKVKNNEEDWSDVMERLDTELGIVVHSGEDGKYRLYEYKAEEEKEESEEN